jgi:hypothetical protein
VFRRSCGTHQFGINQIESAHFRELCVNFVHSHLAGAQGNAEMFGLAFKPASTANNKAEAGELERLPDFLRPRLARFLAVLV